MAVSTSYSSFGVATIPKNDRSGKSYTREEVERLSDSSNNSNQDTEYYFIIHHQVYKVPRSWAQQSHPGGEILLLDGKGTDITIPFLNNHTPEKVDKVLQRFRVGYIDTESGSESENNNQKMSVMEQEFCDLIEEVSSDPQWFEASWLFYGGLIIRYLLILSISIYLLLRYAPTSQSSTLHYFLSTILSAIFMGCFFQQVAFIGHDLGHNGVTHIRALDETIGIIFGNLLSGISVGWWKATHNVHHLVTNSVEYDCDIQHMPIFAVSDKYLGREVELNEEMLKQLKGGPEGSVMGASESEICTGTELNLVSGLRNRTVLNGKGSKTESETNSTVADTADLSNKSDSEESEEQTNDQTSTTQTLWKPYTYGEGVFSHYHMKTFEFDRVSEFLLSYQHYLYYPIMGVARFNLYLQSWLLILPKESYRKWGGNRRTLELVTLGIFALWFSSLVLQFPTISQRIYWLLLSHAIGGLLHVQITISHFPMPVVSGNPLKLGHKQNFIEYQLSGSMDVDCPSYMDWFHGGLQFQAVHHLIPRVPRHNLRRLRDEKIIPFCERHGLEYKKAGFIECNKMVFRTLRETAGKVNYLAEAWNAHG